jgi:DNA-binding winged helix-turn-helix (wHTH) protein
MAGSDPETIEFRLLGAVEAIRSGNPLPLGGRRQRALLALLLLEQGRPVGADRLADELWHGEPPPGASATLRAYVSKLRSVLGAEAVITSAVSGYALDVPADRVDASGWRGRARRRWHSVGRDAPPSACARRSSSVRALLARLSIFAGGCTLAAAAAVCLEGDEERALVPVERLLDASLVVADTGGAGPVPHT